MNGRSAASRGKLEDNHNWMSSGIATLESLTYYSCAIFLSMIKSLAHTHEFHQLDIFILLCIIVNFKYKFDLLRQNAVYT